MGKTSKYGSGSYLETNFLVKIHKFFDADADPGNFLTLDPGCKTFGSEINILDPQYWVRVQSLGSDRCVSVFVFSFTTLEGGIHSCSLVFFLFCRHEYLIRVPTLYRLV